MSIGTMSKDEGGKPMDEIAGEYLSALGLQDEVDFKALAQSNQSPPFSLVKEIVTKHTGTFPFCTMNHVLHYNYSSTGAGLPDGFPSLDLETGSLFDRIVVQRRGGYCFEHNTLVHDVLKHLGYNVRQGMARVIKNSLQSVNESSEKPRPMLLHCVTILEYPHEESEEPSFYLVDAAFGDRGPLQPVPLPLPGTSTTPSFLDPAPKDTLDSRRFFKVVYDPNDPDPFSLVTRYSPKEVLEEEDEAEENAWFITYKFNWPVQYAISDAQMAHFYCHANPEAIFTKLLFVCRHEVESTEEDSTKLVAPMHFLVNLRYRVRSIHGEDIAEERVLASPEEVHQILTTVFNVSPSIEECERLFQLLSAPKENGAH